MSETLPACRVCGVQFREGEDVDASEWTVVDLGHGEMTPFRVETRYQHVTCPTPDVGAVK